jgi:hypothetical protein
MKTAFRFCWSALCGFWHSPAILILMPFEASKNRLQHRGWRRSAALIGHVGHVLAFAWMVQAWWLVGDAGMSWLLG